MIRNIVLTVVLGTNAFFGCAREPSRDAPPANKTPAPAPKPQPTAATGGATRPASLAGMPGPLTPEPGFDGNAHGAKAPATSVKSTGKTGELLEGSVYFFRLLAPLKPCGEQPDPATAKPSARRVVAAEVEITAKETFNVNPRDVAIGVGGIVFNGSVDQKRKLEGCSPLLKIAVLRPKETTKGLVLFDIPVTGPGSDLAEMDLIYQPTRFGGAGPVMVTLREK